MRNKRYFCRFECPLLTEQELEVWNEPNPRTGDTTEESESESGDLSNEEEGKANEPIEVEDSSAVET